MKKFILILLLFGILIGCSDDKGRTVNPYLPNYAFSFIVNMNLPLYSGLVSPVNPIRITDSASNITIIVMRVSGNDFRAWDANCPNQYPTPCSLMTVSSPNAKCGCEDFEYSLFTGIGGGDYSMKPYYVEVLGNNSIRIYNL